MLRSILWQNILFEIEKNSINYIEKQQNKVMMKLRMQ